MPDADTPRLIEAAFPLKQASLDSVHEKSVRHGHISTLHIWPARRPLAACRAALIATLLPDPGTPQGRKELLEKIGGKVVTEVQKKKVGGKTVETVKERTEGGILHWGSENNPDMDWFREEIKKAYGGRAPRVLDPFAGGGAIPLEAMRLGCEAMAIDINPVAWLVLKCTLRYPQQFAGQTWPLPAFAAESGEFMESFQKSTTGKRPKKSSGKDGRQSQMGLFQAPEADLSWHVRAWGQWVHQRATADLERFYPKVDGKPTVAYLWARTVRCKNCRSVVPLLKTMWLCKKDNKRVLLTMEQKPDGSGLDFGVRPEVPVSGKNGSERRAHDKAISAATMTRSGTTCPFCSTIMTWDDLRIAGQAKTFGSMMFAVVVDSPAGKSYRTPTDEEIRLVEDCGPEVERLFATIPFGLPTEATPGPSGPKKRGSSLRNYGLDSWVDLFTPRQLLALGTFVKHTRAVRESILGEGFPSDLAEAVTAYLAVAIDRIADYTSSICSWHNSGEFITHTFGRFAFPIIWDFAEVVPTSRTSGSYLGAIEWIVLFLKHSLGFPDSTPRPEVVRQSSVQPLGQKLDVILTDPPYYDAIPYSDLMDYFYIWLRRTLFGLSPEFDEVFREPLCPKWNHASGDGELVDDPARHGWDLNLSKSLYEEGMFRTFVSCHHALEPDGRLVVVFAHKYPDAWETLVSAMIRAGYVVDGSWPIQTEMTNRTRALSSSALSSSVWLVCKKRPETARPGWDNRVLDEMRHNIHTKLRDYWDAGIRGPDFVWAATGPALEAYSKHPVVKKANEPGKLMEVGEFLRAVRRLVVDFVVGRVLTGDGDETSASGLDDITTYYILHRHDFGLEDAPVGACILYAVSCNLSDSDLTNRLEILLRTGGLAAAEDDEDDTDEEGAETDSDAEPEQGTGSTVKLRPWHQRKRKSLGYDTEGHPAPLIDQAHRLLHLWKAGDVVKVDEYLDARGLRKNALFLQLLQALIELAGEGTEERAILETISNHLVARGVSPIRSRTLPGMGEAGGGE
jgi:putative DNA methylase